jgi:acyl-homoserine lactone acylase PvdQ
MTKTGQADRARRFAVLALATLLAACSVQDLQAEPGRVTVYRDTWGVPHIYGDTEESGYYGLGYAQAEDGLQRVLGATFWVQGRSAELLGDAALPNDIEFRRWRHYEEAKQGFARLSPQLQKNYRAFVAGVERYMADHADQVPKWAPPLTPETLVAVSRAGFWSFYNAQLGAEECTKAGAKLALGLDARHPPPLAVTASNGWFVRPSRTRNGETILLADPHVGMNDGSYYEYRLQGGDFMSAGFAVGALLWQAQNRHVAWALTTGNPDIRLLRGGDGRRQPAVIPLRRAAPDHGGSQGNLPFGERQGRREGVRIHASQRRAVARRWARRAHRLCRQHEPDARRGTHR